MSIWILALVLMASVGALGYRQGAIRVAFSFGAIVIGAFLAKPLSFIFKPILPFLGIKNPVLLWIIAPLMGFVLVQAIIKSIAYNVHRKQEAYYNHQVSELQLSLWKRLNTRLGLCLGLLNGAAYFVLVCFVIFNLGYWTNQIAVSDNQPVTIRTVNKLGSDLQSTGMARAADGVGTLPEDYYRLADLSGFLIQNPDAAARLANYPALTSILQRPEMQSFFTDSTFTNLVANGGSAGDLVNSSPVQQLLNNKDLLNQIVGIFETNFDDILGYLQTGKSAKYDNEKILGTWKVNIPVTLAWLRQDRPKTTAIEMREIGAWYVKAYTDMTILATGDGDVFVKSYPQLRTSPGRPPNTDLIDVQGHWSHNDTGYDVQLKVEGEDKFYSGTANDLRMKLKDGRSQLIFDRQ